MHHQKRDKPYLLRTQYVRMQAYGFTKANKQTSKHIKTTVYSVKKITTGREFYENIRRTL